MTDSTPAPAFRLGYVPGVTPGKWAGIWAERITGTPLELVQAPTAAVDPLLRAGTLDAALTRLPVDRDTFSAIPLYTEATVVVVPKDHLLTALDEATADDLADEVVLHPQDDPLPWEDEGAALPGRPALERPATTADAVELVAAGIGVLVVPQSVARLHHRRDLTFRPLNGAPQSRVALAWPEAATTDRVEDLIGIVRGRTANSTRGEQEAKAKGSGGGRAKAESAGGRAQPGGRKGGSGAERGRAGGGQRSGGTRSSGGRPTRGRSAAPKKGRRR